MRKLALSRTALDFINALEAKQFRQVMRKILSLLVDPLPPDSQQLQGFGPELRRTDIGEYRIVYQSDDSTVAVVVVGKRNDDEVYKKLKRK